MHAFLSRSGPIVVRVYAGLTYVASLMLLFGAAVLTSTHARAAFIFVFLPGVLFAVLSVFIWSGHRAAMILAFAVAVSLELMLVDNARDDWMAFLPFPVMFGLLMIAACSAPLPSRAHDGAPARVADEVYAAVVYFAGLLAAFMAPFNLSRNFGLPIVGLYALVVGLVLGALSILIWRGRVWAMIAAFALALAHWIALAMLDPLIWQSVPFIAAPVAAGVLTVVCVGLSAREKRRAQLAVPSE